MRSSGSRQCLSPKAIRISNLQLRLREKPSRHQSCTAVSIMVQLLVRLVVPPDHFQEVLQALRVVMLPAARDRGCSYAQICQRVDDPRRVTYVEEWTEAAELQRQFGSDRFLRLLEVLEMSAEPPLLEFRVIKDTYGLDYIKTGTDSIRPVSTKGPR